MRVDTSAIEEYRSQGYLVIPGLFGPEALTELHEAFARLETRALALKGPTTISDTLFMVQPTETSVRIERIVWCGGVEPVLGALGHSAEIVQIAATLLGSDELDQLINQAHIKNPGDATKFDWHQDSYHRRYGTDLWTDLDGRGSFVQIIAAVDAMGAENGGLLVVPESHRQGHVSTPTGILTADRVDASRAIAPVLAPGDALALSPFTIHGSAPNRGTAPRRVFINGFALPEANRREYPGAGTGYRVRRDQSATKVERAA